MVSEADDELGRSTATPTRRPNGYWNSLASSFETSRSPTSLNWRYKFLVRAAANANSKKGRPTEAEDATVVRMLLADGYPYISSGILASINRTLGRSTTWAWARLRSGNFRSHPCLVAARDAAERGERGEEKTDEGKES